ncbi:MAG: sugar transporter, permease protein [Actinomycetia bacterium]|nr:sugar transporter, permease protein [Actinomycetes bacterium]
MASAPAVAAKGDTRRRLGWAPYALLAPSLVYLAVFFALPMVNAFGLAFQGEAGGYSLEPVRRMLGDGRFGDALRTTLLLVVIIVPIQFAVAMSMALVVNARLRGTDLWLYIFALPLGISELAAGIVWFSIFTEQGWLNSFLTQLGVLDRPFIFLDYQRPVLLILTIVVAEAWRATSIIMVILVAGLQGIPRDYLEAADVFGATPWQRVRHVILPLLRPSIRVALILRTILAFQVFATVIALAGSATNVLAGEAYRWYQNLRDARVAAAYATLILILSVASTVLFLLLLPTEEDRSA